LGSGVHCFKLSVIFTENFWQPGYHTFFCKFYRFCKLSLQKISVNFYRNTEMICRKITENFCKILNLFYRNNCIGIPKFSINTVIDALQPTHSTLVAIAGCVLSSMALGFIHKYHLRLYYIA
jgi:hypothetical protein